MNIELLIGLSSGAVSVVVSVITWLISDKFSIFAEATNYDYCSKRREELLNHYTDLIKKMSSDSQNLFLRQQGTGIGNEHFANLKIHDILNSTVTSSPHFWKELYHLKVSWKRRSKDNPKYSKYDISDLIEHDDITTQTSEHNLKVNEYIGKLRDRIKEAINPLIKYPPGTSQPNKTQNEEIYTDFFCRVVYDFFNGDKRLDLFINSITVSGINIIYNGNPMGFYIGSISESTLRQSLRSILADASLKNEFDKLKQSFLEIQNLIDAIKGCFKQCIMEMKKEKDPKDNYPTPIAECCPKYNKKKCVKKFGIRF